MLSTRHLRLVASCALAVLLLGSATARAEELPPGFTDGTVVGSDDAPSTASSVAPSATVGTAATTMRYFGREPYEAVRAAAATAAGAATCIMSVDGLTGLVLAPVFKESSAATTPSTAPSPMTLSRYDEWSGTYGTNSNVNANYGLYAFRDPYTTYQRAYWHPGIGIWQYDSAGARRTVHDRGVDARGHGGRRRGPRSWRPGYCNPSSSQSGTPRPSRTRSGATRPGRAWGYPCTLCESYFQEMTSTTPRFANLGLVEGIGALGGTVARTCTLVGVSGTLPCWYVEPVVGVIQGATAWATLSPSGGSGPTVAPAPLSYPFYVVDRGATEERHWLREDTGYDIDIRASRQIGKNARPRSTQAGSGLTWASTSGLCDIVTGHGTCGPVPPPGVSSSVQSVGGSYRSIPLDANGDGQGDVLWYTPGTGADALVVRHRPGHLLLDPARHQHVLRHGGAPRRRRRRRRRPAVVRPRPVTPRSGGSTAPRSRRPRSSAGSRPHPAADGAEQQPGRRSCFWYGPGSTGDAVWAWNGSGFTHRPTDDQRRLPAVHR